MYTQIEGMMTAGEAADALVFHATNIACAIKRKDNTVFEHREASLNAVLRLLGQYVQQERGAEPVAKQPVTIGATKEFELFAGNDLDEVAALVFEEIESVFCSSREEFAATFPGDTPTKYRVTITKVN